MTEFSAEAQSAFKKQLPADYFERYPEDTVSRHLALLRSLESDRSVKLEAVRLSEGHYQVTLVSEDFLGLLSIVTGLFSSFGFNIIRGQGWTLPEMPVSAPIKPGKRKRKYFIDVFELEAPCEPDWQVLNGKINQYVQQVEKDGFEDVRRQINQEIVRFFRARGESEAEKLHPIRLDIHQDLSPDLTVVDIQTQDTVAFLYELTSALSQLEINVVRMEIETKGALVEDRFWLTTKAGEKITLDRKLKELRWAILFLKQFTHLLPNVPDPAAAMDQMSLFGKEMFERPDFEKVVLALEDSKVLRDLSRIFGTSKFLWEDFIRTQHESFIPLLENQTVLKKRKSKSEMKRELIKALRLEESFSGKVERLNQFKDREIFRTDLRHLLRRTSYLSEFAEEFSDLAEVVVEAACHLSWDEAAKKSPPPMVSPREKSELAVLALGKFGGRELGYASDLELLFVYTDAPDSASDQSNRNLEFYSELVRIFHASIWARREGIFALDLRLRPHGDNGPLASSLEAFKTYYSAAGNAWSYERQALVRLRPVAGSAWLGKEAERLRDEFVYGPVPLNFEEAQSLRERQQRELTGGKVNAKFSAGGLLDIEYAVQVLQIAFGRTHLKLRRTNTLHAIQALWEEGILTEEEFQSIRASYLFIRDLINALRIFRGNAKDLTIPDRQALEFVILARRMGYQGDDEAVRLQLAVALSHHSDVSARFYRDWMSKLAGKPWEEISRVQVTPHRELRISLDELLSGDLSDESKVKLNELGFMDIEEGASAIRRLFPGTLLFGPFSKVFDQTWAIWPEVADPNLAAKHWGRLSENIKRPADFWNSLAQNPESIRTLLKLLGSSEYLSEILITHPEYWRWVCDPKEPTLQKASEALSDWEGKQARAVQADGDFELLRQFRHRETLRIALVENAGGSSLTDVYRAFSRLADMIIRNVFDSPDWSVYCCVIGLGKLGAEELNFSSDVDLMFVSDGLDTSQTTALIQHLQRSVNVLKAIGPNGFLYRTDLRLRPFGADGALVLPLADTIDYYDKQADQWEHQMLIKARPVAGPEKIGAGLLSAAHRFLFGSSWDVQKLDRIREVKRRFEARTRSKGEESSHIKMGFGGIRDIEFTVQYLQLLHGAEHASLRVRGTLEALQAIQALGLLPEKEVEILGQGYEFLRRIENKLHLFNNRQTFIVPTDALSLRRLAKSMGFRDTRTDRAENIFHSELGKRMLESRTIFEKIFYAKIT